MADTQNLQVATFEQLATLLSQVAQNNTNLSLTYYNMFYNTTPQDITLRLYNTDGVLQEFTVPNRAKDFNYIKNGEGSPEGRIVADVGTIYQDTLNGKLYIKSTGSDAQGWVEFANNDLIKLGNNNPNGIVSAPQGTLYINASTSTLYIKSTSTGSNGWIQVNANLSNVADVDLSNVNVGASDAAGNKIRSAILGGASSVVSSDLSANKALISNGLGKIVVSSTTGTELEKLHGLTSSTAELNVLDGITASTAELNYVDGVTSNIQTQLNNKVNKSGDTMTGNLKVSTASNPVVTLKNTSYTNADTFSSDVTLGQFRVYGNDDAPFLYMGSSGRSNGSMHTHIVARRSINGSNKESAIYLVVNSAGNPSCSINESTEIAGSLTTTSNASIGGTLTTTSNATIGGTLATGATVIDTTSGTPLTLKGKISTSTADSYQDIQCLNTSNNRVGVIRFQDTGTVNRLSTSVIQRGTNTLKGGTVLSCDNDGNLTFNFPKCETQPTTTSTASDAKVAVVVRNYLNGNNWYRKWSDGFIEQGGVVTSGTGGASSSGNTNISFNTNFALNSYTFVAVCNACTDDYSRFSSFNIISRSTSQVKGNTMWYNSGGAGQYALNVYWYACGY